jgi:hypothetical protein
MRLSTPDEIRATRRLDYGNPVIVAMPDGTERQATFQGNSDLQNVFVQFGDRAVRSIKNIAVVRPA